MDRKIVVLNHDPKWIKMFSAEVNRLRTIFGLQIIEIHHIGSTAINTIKAKPIIDLMPVVKNIQIIDEYNSEMIRLGYIPRGEFGIPGRRYFIKGSEINRSHHIHMFEEGHLDIERLLNFRDYLITHPKVAFTYSKLKEELAFKYSENIEGYIKGKDDFIKKVDEKAKIWRETTA